MSQDYYCPTWVLSLPTFSLSLPIWAVIPPYFRHCYRWLDLCTPQTCMYTQYPTLKLISWSLPAVKSYRASAFGVRSSDNWVVLRVTLVPVAKMWLYDDYRSIISILMVSITCNVITKCALINANNKRTQAAISSWIWYPVSNV